MSIKTVVRQVSLPQLFHTGHIPADDPLEEHRLQAEHEDSNTSPHGHDAPQTYFSRHANNGSSNAHALAQAQDESLLLVGVIIQSHTIVSRLIATSWACLPILFTFQLYWRRNLAQTAPIHGAVHGLTAWLNEARSQVMSPTA